MSDSIRISTLGLLPILANAILGLATLGLLYPEELGGGGGGGSGKGAKAPPDMVDYPHYYSAPRDPVMDHVIYAVAAGLIF